VSFGVSKANSGIIHGGFHHPSSTLKARLEVTGNMMFDRLQKELHFPFRRCGVIVAAFTVEEMKTVQRLYETGVENRSIGIELCNRDRILQLEPKLNHDAVGGLFAPSGGIIEPYRFAFSLVECAVRTVCASDQVQVFRAALEGESRRSARSTGRDPARWVTTQPASHADEKSAFFGEEYDITPRKGREFLMDRNDAGIFRVVFPTSRTARKCSSSRRRKERPWRPI
jgi:glycerol-3-phosphate dehydrogenase